MKFHIFFFFIFNISFAQQYNQAIYDININEDRFKEKFENTLSDRNKGSILMTMFNSANNSNLFLRFDDLNSVCDIADFLRLDNQENFGRGMLDMFNAGKPIYMDCVNAKMYEKRDAGSESHLVEIPIKNYNWQLIKGEENISGFVSRRAISVLVDDNGNKTTTNAWYYPNIPVQYGPAIFNGLPGLITKIVVDDDRRSLGYTIKLKELTYEEKIVSTKVPFDKYDVLTIDESEAFYRKLNGKIRN